MGLSRNKVAVSEGAAGSPPFYGESEISKDWIYAKKTVPSTSLFNFEGSFKSSLHGKHRKISMKCEANANKHGEKER